MAEKKKIAVLGCKNWAKDLIGKLGEDYDIITMGERKDCEIYLSFDIESKWDTHKIPEINGLLNIGKISELKGLIETPAEKWKAIVNSNLKLIYKSINFFSEFIAPGGSIVNILEAGQMEGLGGALIYDAFEKESTVLTKSLAYTYANKKIRINSIRIGYIDTEDLMGAGSKLKEIYLKNAKKNIPIGFVADITDINNLVSFLLSDKSRYITGNVINLDGGISTKG